jgi:2'-5' RNA ligase
MEVEVIVAFVLAFSSEVGRALIDYSESLQARSDVTLGLGALPHATLVQVECDEAEALSAWNELGSLPRPLSVTASFAGLCLLPASTGECWVEIPILGGRDLFDLQESILGLPSLAGKKVYNGTGVNFRPHVTVALYRDASDVPAPLPLPSDLLRAGVTGTVSLGLTGENYSFTDVWR